MIPQKLVFSPLARRQIEADFSGGHITSDAGLLVLREIDKRYGLTRKLAGVVPDTRAPEKVRHSTSRMLAQRVYALAGGYEDLNDHEQLRFDHALQSALNTDTPLAGKSTLSRMEQRADRRAIIEAHRLLWEHFIQRHRKAPEELVLDFDGTDIALHGEQPGKHFHRHYGHHCYLPLYVFCGRELLVSYLRRSDRSDAHHSLAVLSLLVRFLRAHWPNTRIVFRGDAGFYRPRLLAWCDRHSVDYLVGFTKNARLLKQVERQMAQAKADYERTGKKAVRTCLVPYRANTWRTHRWVVARLEHGPLGANPRFVISSKADGSFRLYYEQYCARGDMENRIKDQQLDLFADRTSSPSWWANQWRLMLSGFAYVLFERLRDELKDSAFARMSIHNLRLKLIKIGAIVLRNTRRIRLLISDAYPYKAQLADLVRRLVPT